MRQKKTVAIICTVLFMAVFAGVLCSRSEITDNITASMASNEALGVDQGKDSTTAENTVEGTDKSASDAGEKALSLKKQVEINEMLDGAEYSQDEIIVEFDKDISENKADQIIDANNCESGADIELENSGVTKTVKLASDQSVKEALEDFYADDCIASVQPNYIYRLSEEDLGQSEDASVQSEDTSSQSEDASVQSEDASGQSEDASGQSEDASVQSEEALEKNISSIKSNTKDPYIEKQYQFDNTNTKKAWAFLEEEGKRKSSDPVKVAVIDTGVDIGHEDLQVNFKNNGFSDNSSYIQTVNGKKYTVTSDPRDPRKDTNGHGTHVAGIIGATFNNGAGGAGIAAGNDNEYANVMVISASEGEGKFSTADMVAAINYAIDKGAEVVNMSITGDGQDALQAKAIRAGYKKDIIFVAASGNERSDKAVNPADQKEVIGVNATNSNDKFCDYYTSSAYGSNYGMYKDICAPGDSVLSTTSRYSKYWGDYTGLSGTSMATPVVTGVIALMKNANPDLTPEQAYNILCTTVNKKSQNKSFDEYYAYGIVDAEAAVKAASEASEETAATKIEIKPYNSGFDSEKQKHVTIGKDEDIALEAVVTPAESLEDITWTSSNTSVVTVDSDTGTLKGIKTGYATVTAKVGDGTGDKKDSCIVVVGAPLSGVEINSAAVRMTVGASYTFNAYGLDGDKYKDATAVPVWSSSDTSVATVNKTTGKVLAKKEGTVKITATAYYYTYSEYDQKICKFTRKASTTLAVGNTSYAGKDYKLKMLKRSKSAVMLGWKYIPVAGRYVIQRATKKNGTYKTVAVIKNAKTVKYINKGLKSKKTYYYRIRASFGSKFYYSWSSKVRTVTR